jgi:VWFA-related protein
VNTPFEDQAYARQKIVEYLKTNPPSTRIAVFTLASRLRLVQGFTTDSAILLEALKRVTPVQSPSLPGNTGQNGFNLGLNGSPIGSGALDTVIETLHQFEADEQVALLERRIQITVDALKQLALYLGALPGRKNVIWVSAAFPLSLVPESPLDPFRSLRSYARELQQVSDLLTASRVAVYPIDARGLILPPPPPRQNRPTAVAIGGGRTGVIDPNAFPSAPAEANDRSQAELATMLQLAEQTGGSAFYNSNAIKQNVAKAVEHGSSYYTLAYSPDDTKFDGSFRKLQVKLGGHNYQLAYRRGYFAEPAAAHGANALLGLDFPSLRPDAPPSSQIFFQARIVGAGDPIAQDLQPQPGPAGDLAAKLKPPVKRYWIEYTADMRQVSAEVDSSGVYRSIIEFIVIAYDRDGKVVNAARRSFRLGMPPGKYDELLRTGYSVSNEIDLPEGDAWLRLAVHDVAADRVGSIEVPLKIVTRTEN